MPNLAPCPATIRTPYGNVTTYHHVYQPMHYGNKQVSLKYEFTAVLANDSVLTGRTRIDVSEKNNAITFKTANGKISVNPGMTRELYRVTETGLKLAGQPADSSYNKQ